MKRLSISAVLFFVSGLLISVFSVDNQTSRLINSPKYFGPNAFPVPEMLDGRVSDRLKIDMSASVYEHTIFPFGEDITGTLSARLVFPLFSSKANLVVWGQVLEGFRTVYLANGYKGVTGSTKGLAVGDIYVSTDIQLFSQEKHYVNVALRAALKSASGGDYPKARFYDSPGYFFDIAAGHDFIFSDVFSLTCAATTGFLCWQTGINVQNDAVMYGIIADLNTKAVNIKVHWGGYVGWQKNGDCPMVIRTDIYRRFKNVNLSIGYENGIVDFPYRCIKFGVEIMFGTFF